ncbi:MAG: 5-(carboxyamino)imidazole ribonucleotide mutase [Candidatus Omnitrophica bacterium]|nr:5-(carboxyamino)imidazole ribonucleotide mutase [Candidatus Omnitrophota bacterium]
MSKPVVGVIMGSDSDWPAMKETAVVLKKFKVEFEVKVLSAHRSPDKSAEYAKQACSAGIKVIIAGAGGAAHLAGVLAGHTVLPVIGVPMGSDLMGLDSLLATVSMPSGIPVAVMAIGPAGAKNAGILAVQILALSDEGLARKLVEHKKSLADSVSAKSEKLQEKLSDL